jgi:hypothetical protein
MFSPASIERLEAKRKPLRSKKARQINNPGRGFDSIEARL